MKINRLLIIVFMLLLILTACEFPQIGGEADPTALPTTASSPTENTSQAAVPTAGPLAQANQASSFFNINEVGLGPDGYIALTNFVDVPVATGGLYLCQGANCFALPDAVVGSGETVRIAAGSGEGLENVIATGANFGELRPADGEIALFKSLQADPKSLLVYLQWGSTPHDLTKIAVDAGLWFETSYAPSSANATRLYRVPESGLWLFNE